MYQNRLTGLSTENIAASLLLLASVIAMSVTCYYGLFSPLEYDEAYNLQVVDNLAKGNGYASYGAIRGEGLWLFDPNITTGPVILEPLALLWHITNGSLLAVRVFMLSFLGIYVTGLYFLFRDKRNTPLIPALAISSSLCIACLPESVLGEVPAAAAIVWAAWAVSKNKFVIAGLAVGLAIQTKLVFGLAGAAVLTAWLIANLLTRQQHHWFKNIFLAGFFAIMPTLIFEVYRFFSLPDLNAYLFSIDELKSFLRTQNINNTGTWLNPDVIGVKFVSLYQILPFLGWFASGVFAFIFFIGSVIKLIKLPKIEPDQKFDLALDSNNNSKTFLTAAIIGLAVAGSLMLINWFTQSAQIAARQGLPFLLLFGSTFFALGGYYYFEIKNSLMARKIDWIIKSIGIIGVTLLLAALCYRINSRLHNNSADDRLKEQYKVTELIKQSGAKSLFVEGWWQHPEYQLLAGIPAVPVRTANIPQLLLIEDYQISIGGGTWNDYLSKCSRVIYSSPRILLCWPHNIVNKNVDIKVIDWNPRTTRIGVVPNEQIDGGAGLMIKTEKINIAELGPIKVLFSGTPAWSNYQAASGDFITASIPPRFFKKSGKYEVSIKQLTTGRISHVGYFDVK